MKKLVIAVVMILGLVAAACGGKSKSNTTPANKGGATDPKVEPAGGTTYGGTGSAPNQMKPTDPCGG